MRKRIQVDDLAGPFTTRPEQTFIMVCHNNLATGLPEGDPSGINDLHWTPALDQMRWHAEPSPRWLIPHSSTRESPLRRYWVRAALDRF
jgi:hypothetical protein